MIRLYYYSSRKMSEISNKQALWTEDIKEELLEKRIIEIKNEHNKCAGRLFPIKIYESIKLENNYEI